MGLIIPRNQKVLNAGRVRTQPVPLRPPITGWNTRDSFDAMEATDAITMDNWYADAGGIISRNGSSPYATGLDGPVKTITQFYGGANRKMIAAAGGKIYDVKLGPTISTVIKSGFDSDIWSTQNFKGSLFLANGLDPVQRYDGTAIAPAGFTGPPTPPVGVFLFKERLYLWEADSQSFWYPATIDAITGPLTEFPLGTVAELGGNIMLITNFSHDGGDGVTNMFCIVMTTGEVILYLGNDPGDATTWQLSGQYHLAAPINARSAVGYGADVYLTTYDDHVALQEQLVALKVGTPPPRSKISGAVRDATLANADAFGWDAIFYAAGRRLLFNIPNTDGTYDQHVFNTNNQTWQRFTGMNALCWTEFGRGLYFGTMNGQVWQADVGPSDNGATIPCFCQQAWNQIEIPYRKRLAALRPVLQILVGQSFRFSSGFDYRPLFVEIGSVSTILLPYWDISFWDVTFWDVPSTVTTGLYCANGTGTALSVALSADVISPMTWIRTDLLLEQGKTV